MTELIKSNLTEQQDQLWKVLLAKVDAITAEDANSTSTRRSVALIDSDGAAVSTVYEMSQPDGSTRVYFITARTPSRFESEPSIEVRVWFHNSEPFWEEQLADRSDAVVAGDQHYRIKAESSAPPYCRGYGGRRFVIRFFDGREVTTTNLWHQGTIPPVFRDRMPPNAEFVSGGA